MPGECGQAQKWSLPRASISGPRRPEHTFAELIACWLKSSASKACARRGWRWPITFSGTGISRYTYCSHVADDAGAAYRDTSDSLKWNHNVIIYLFGHKQNYTRHYPFRVETVHFMRFDQ